MSARRRHADNFTDSLHGFHQTINEEDSQDATQIYSEDSLNINSIRNKQYRNDKYKEYAKNNEHCGSSDILVDNLTNEQLASSSSSGSYRTAEESNNILFIDKGNSVKDTFNLLDQTSYVDIPDLNKCMDLFHNEYLKKKHDIHKEYSSIPFDLSENNRDKENIDPYHISKGKTLEVQHNLIDTHSHNILPSSLKHAAVSDKKVRRSKSCTTLYEKTGDTDHNIKASPFFLAPMELQIEATTKIGPKKVETMFSSFHTLLLDSSSSSSRVDNPHSTEDKKHISISNESTKDELSTSDKTSNLNAPDLNKCIDLFHNEYLKRKHDTHEEYSSILPGLSENNRDKENIDPYQVSKGETEVQRNLIDTHSHNISSSSLKHAAVFHKGVRRSKSCTALSGKIRDTNHNITASPFFLAPMELQTEATTKIGQKKIETMFSSFHTLSLDSSPSSSRVDNPHSTEEDKKHISISSESTKDELSVADLRTFLQSLVNQPSEPSKNKATDEQMLRRLSVTFYDSPKNFTERLLTIIEESVVHNDSNMPMEVQEVSLCRLTAELRKMCKFIENETEPEWPSSLGISMSVCAKDGNQEPGSDFMRRLSLSTPPDSSKKLYLVASPNTPRRNIKSPKKIYQYTPKSAAWKTSIAHSINTTNTPNTNDSTSVFESLEEYCKSLYPDEYKTPSMERNKLQSPLQNVSIWRAYNDQMASLQNSPIIYEQLKDVARTPVTTLDSASQRDTVPETKTVRCKLLTHEKCDKRESSIPPRSRRSKNCDMIEPDDLETTLIYEIAKKRKRCLDTARMMMEIDANPDSAETLQMSGSSVVAEASSSTNNDAKLMEMLMSCKRYKDYLEKQKPLLNLIEQTELRRSNSLYNKKERSAARAKPGNKVNLATLKVPELLITYKGNRSPLPAKSPMRMKAVATKPKFFVTPGKTAQAKTVCKKKRTYFPNLVVNPAQDKKLNITPQAKRIAYRRIGLNYDNVISPVGMYIRGTTPHLVKNLRPKTDQMLLTPRKIQTPPSATPRSKMRFKLSPKRNKETPPAVENRDIPTKFMHPKVLYKLPSQVCAIKETENRKMGSRLNKLLSSVQDKVVIRHEGRTKTVQKYCLDEPEIHYDSVDESLHIEQTARKTCFSNAKKNYYKEC